MLLYTIKSKTAWESVKEKFHGPRHARHNFFPQQQEPPRCQWGKEQYAKWIEEKVKTKFKKGDLVTFASCPPMPTLVPYNMKISYIHEMHHYIEYDPQLQEPKAVTCETMNHQYENKCPSTLRLLTTEELALVDLSNKKAFGNC